MRSIRLALALAVMSAASAATAAPPPVTVFPPPIQPSGITAHLTPFITVPADSPTAPRVRINYATALPGGSGRIFVNDLGGVLYQAGRAGGMATAYLDVNAQGVGAVAGAGFSGPGLSGYAFHPGFDTQPGQPGYGRFYTSTNILNPGAQAAGDMGDGTGARVIEIREWTTIDPAAATFQGTSRVVTRISGYFDDHSNASIAFNPTARSGDADYGKLYIGSGDGRYNDADHNAQNLAVPQGKMLRIDPLQAGDGAPYSSPADNPFVNQAGALPQVWAYGLRYPQTFGWDPATGAMYINDLGQAAVEEVNVGVAGGNYGWSMREGTYATGAAYGFGTDDEQVYPVTAEAAAGAFRDPIALYTHLEGNALGSGFLYRGAAIPALTGRYVLADIVNGRLFLFDPAAASPGGQAPLTELLLTDGGAPYNLLAALGYDNPFGGQRVDARLGQDENGELLLALKSTGQVYRIEADVPEPASALLIAPALALLCLRRAGRSRPPASRCS